MKTASKSLTVTLTGPAASGKTTLALALQQFLVSRGFAVEVVDPDLVYSSYMPGQDAQDRRMENLSGVLTVRIETKSVARK